MRNALDWSNNNPQGSFEISMIKDISKNSKCSSKYQQFSNLMYDLLQVYTEMYILKAD